MYRDDFSAALSRIQQLEEEKRRNKKPSYWSRFVKWLGRTRPGDPNEPFPNGQTRASAEAFVRSIPEHLWDPDPEEEEK